MCGRAKASVGTPCSDCDRPHPVAVIDLTPPPPPTPAQLRRDAQRFHRVLIGVALFIVALAALWWAEHQFGLDLRAFSIHPRAPEHLIGVLTVPTVLIRSQWFSFPKICW